jgi:hypothetical protein
MHFESVDTCEALNDIGKARNSYANLLNLYPDFALGYSSEGIMLLQQLAYLKHNRSSGCRTAPATPEQLQVTLGALEKEIEQLFQDAVIRDPKLLDAGFQWGTLLFQEQVPDWLQTHVLQADEHRDILDRAAEKYRKALKVKCDDYYIWFLLGIALVERDRLASEADTAQYRSQAIAALCNSVKLNSRDHTLKDTARKEADKISGSPVSCELPKSKSHHHQQCPRFQQTGLECSTPTTSVIITIPPSL